MSQTFIALSSLQRAVEDALLSVVVLQGVVELILVGRDENITRSMYHK
jgi:hypothetical protein